MKKEEAEAEDEIIRELQKMKDELLEDMFENTSVMPRMILWDIYCDGSGKECIS